MNEKAKNFIVTGLFALFCAAFCLALLLGRDAAWSQSERRTLAQRPVLSGESLRSGRFMTEFEAYVQDQFPLRESFRSLKALTARYGFGQKVVNGLYEQQGSLCAVEDTLNEAMLEHAGERFRYIYENYLAPAGCRVWLSIVPDKHYYLAEGSRTLSMDYEALVNSVREKTEYMEYIDLFPLLSAGDYYRTDSHWRQECLLPAAGALAQAMGAELSASYETVTVQESFYGVYAGRWALPVEPDVLSCLANDVLAGCSVTGYGTGLPQAMAMYDDEAAEGRDPYEMFLGGAQPLVVIENPAAESDRELIVFRDSFGSALAPLLAEAYRRITLVDIRYVQSAYLASFVDFHGQDVLFLYSTSLLNNSLALR